MPRLETRRLVFRELTMDHRDFVGSMLADPAAEVLGVGPGH
jgi:hypothetical protein